ncbi:hypothetical protein H632_c2455p0, partial [Helicosporidium sp. ATCC 50920]
MSQDNYSTKATTWNTFFNLFTNDKGIKLRLSIPDTIPLRLGKPVAWYYTDKDGCVQRQPPSRLTLEEVARHLCRCSPDFDSPYAAVARWSDGLPKLLTRPALLSLVRRLDASGGSPVAAPSMLQAFSLPTLDLRYLAHYTNDGVTSSCHTHQRRYGARYLPLRGEFEGGEEEGGGEGGGGEERG